MLQNRDIIITGIQSWNISIGSNCKNIANELSKSNRVLYVNPPLDRLSILRGNSNAKKIWISNKKDNTKTLTKINENLWVLQPQKVLESISQLPLNSLFDYLNKRNNEIFANEIIRASKSLNFKNFIHFCDSDMFRSYYLKELIKPSLSVYYTRDNLLAVKYWQRQGARIEPLLMKKADLVLANSTYLASLAKQFNSHSFFVGQGCDINAFKSGTTLSIPDDVRSIPRPIIGYVGALKSIRLNISLLEHIALVRPKWNIVLVGPEDEKFKESNLHKLSNVHFMGSKQEYELPEYVKAFDVAINPQIINEVTKGNYPRKIDEYLSMGKPTVATKTDAMDYFKSYVSLPSTYKEWISCIEYELNNRSEKITNDRISFASKHTWKNNVHEIGRRILKREIELKNLSLI